MSKQWRNWRQWLNNGESNLCGGRLERLSVLAITGQKTLRKINRLIKSIERDGVLEGEGKPEKLKYREGKYSRRINEADRLVYSVGEDGIEVVSCRGHYED